MSQGYVYDQSWQEERARIAGMEALWDPGTVALLERMGIGEDWRCLEVGAGGGTIVQWLAERAAHVTATDIDPRFVEPLASDSIEVLKHDVRTDPLDDEAFDLIHARLVLEHLPERREVIDRLVCALRPGGVLLVEDYDWSCFGFDPPDELADRAAGAVLAFMENAGFEGRYGRRVVGDLSDAGLDDVSGEGRAYLIASDHPGFAFFRLSFQQLAPAVVAAGGLSQDDATEMIARMDEDDSRVITPLMVGAWGRRSR